MWYKYWEKTTITGCSHGNCSSSLSEKWKRQDGNMWRWKLQRGIETFNMDTEQHPKKIKGNAVWRKQGGKKTVREGRARWRRCKMWRCNTDTCAHSCFYKQTLLGTYFLIHRHLYIRRCICTPNKNHTHTWTETTSRILLWNASVVTTTPKPKT